MKGIIKHNNLLYKKSFKPISEGDLIILECKRGSDYYQYNGIYTVGKFNSIRIERKDELPLGLKLGYNVPHDCFFKLVLTKRKKSLPNLIKEEDVIYIRN